MLCLECLQLMCWCREMKTYLMCEGTLILNILRKVTFFGGGGGAVPVIEWFMTLALTALCLLPLPGFESK